MNRNFINQNFVKDQIEKSITGEFGFGVIISDIEKSKYYREIKVKKSDGSWFTRRQLVGSEKEDTTSKYMTYEDIKATPEIYNHVDWLIKRVVWHDGKFYTVEKRTKSAKPQLFEVDLSPVDKRIKMEGEDMEGSPWRVTGVKEANEDMLEKVKAELERLDKLKKRMPHVDFKTPKKSGPHKMFLEKQPKTLDQANENRLDKQTREANSWLNTNLTNQGERLKRSSLLSFLNTILDNHNEITNKTKIEYEVEGTKGITTVGKLIKFLSKKVKEDEENSKNILSAGIIGKTKITILKEKETE